MKDYPAAIMLGGGRSKSTGKLTLSQQLENDELFKQIGGQLGVSDFDYNKWQRDKTTHAGNTSVLANNTPGNENHLIANFRVLLVSLFLVKTYL